MFFRRMFGVFFLALVFFGFFGLVNNNRAPDAYTQGYIAGQQSVVVGEDGAVTAVSPPAPTAPHQSGFGFIKLFGLFIFGGMFLFGMMIFFGFMKMMCGKHGWRKGDWNKGGWHHARHWGEWQAKGDKEAWYDEHGPSDEPVMKA